MHFAKHTLFGLAAAAMTILSMAAGAAQAENPSVWFTIKNEGVETLSPLTTLGAGETIDRALKDILPGTSESHKITSARSDRASTHIEYRTESGGICSWTVSQSSSYGRWNNHTVTPSQSNDRVACRIEARAYNAGKYVGSTTGVVYVDVWIKNPPAKCDQLAALAPSIKH